LFFAGLSVGVGALVGYETWLHHRVERPARSGDSAARGGPGAMAATEAPAPTRGHWSPVRRLALLIAVGIGLNIFAEGLAIGGSAAQGQIGLCCW
jgi:ZIP family zinc transporter